LSERLDEIEAENAARADDTIDLDDEDE